MSDPTPDDPSRPQPVALISFPDREYPNAPLPTPLTSFVGREREIEQVRALLRRDEVRLLTLTGPGGVGKTRLALRVVAGLVSAFPDGVVFVPLAPIRDPDQVLPAIARALGVREGGDRSLAPRVATSLRDRTLLLILDNLEQVPDAAPRLADLLGSCPSLTVLATSRAVLRISGEHDVPVPPLALPAAGRSFSVEELARAEAVALFTERAQAADPGFALTEANAASVVAICRRLDGLPLAIELAAARVPVLTPRALEARLTARLRLLTGGALDQPPRLRTMQDAIAWSSDLLTPEDQSLFRCLAVFADGGTIEAAEAVCGQTCPDVLDGVTALVGHSLLGRLDPPGPTPRFGMLETVREFAREQLDASGEAGATLARHAAYFVDLAGRPKTTWWVVEETVGEEANLRAALAWAVDRGIVEHALPLGIAVWQLLAPAADYAALERSVAATAGAAPSLHGKRTLLLAATAQYAMWRSHHDRAVALLDECMALLPTTANSPEVALATMVLGFVAIGLGDLDQCEALAVEAGRRWQALDEPGWVGEVLFLRASAARVRGEREQAESLAAESVAIARAVGPAPALAAALGFIANCVFERGDHRRAAALLEESIELARRGRDPIIAGANLAPVAAVAAAAGQAQAAVRLVGAATAWKERAGFDAFPTDIAWQDLAMGPARAQLEASVFDAAWRAGRALTLDQAVEEARKVAAAVASMPPAHAPQRAVDPDALTPRELQVLRLLAEGLPNRAIGAALSISPETARRHATNIYAKLGVTSRAAATALAHRRGLV